MRDLIRMWSNTRMIVLVAISAAVYAAILIPFKPIPIIPGVTELRPANSIPPLASFLFGPAAAWGIAFGNLIGDFFGTLGPVTAFGFLGNFLLGWMPYRMWRGLSSAPMPAFLVGAKSDGGSSAIMQLAEYAFIVTVSSAACALVIGWGGLLFQAFPARIVAPVIFFNNLSWSLVVSPFVMRAVAPRIRAWGLTADQILDPEPPVGHSRRLVGLFLVPASSLGGLLLLYFLTGSSPLAAGVDPRWALGVPTVLVFVGTALL